MEIALFDANMNRFLITTGHSDVQKVERAFAAELLAPAAAVAAELATSPEAATQEDLDRVAAKFQVSPLVVFHQVENQLLHPSLG